MAGRCGCTGPGGCSCSFADSETVTRTGTGSPSSPYMFNVIGGPGGEGAPLLAARHIPFLIRTADGAVPATVATMSAPGGMAGIPADDEVYLFDGTTQAIMLSNGGGLAGEVSPIDPVKHYHFDSGLFIDLRIGFVPQTQARLWYRTEQDAEGTLRFIVLNGMTHTPTTGTVTPADGDTVLIDGPGMAGAVTITMPPSNLPGYKRGELVVIVTGAPAHTITLSGELIDGGMDPTLADADTTWILNGGEGAVHWYTVYKGATLPNSTGSAGSGVFVFNSGGAQSGNRYNDWADLVTALAAAPEGDKLVQIEQSETIPAGAWDLNQARLWAPFIAPGVTLTFADGATIANLSRFSSTFGIVMISESSAPVYVIEPGREVVLDGSTIVVGSPTAPFFDAQGDFGSGLSVMTLKNSALVKRTDIFLPAGPDAGCVSVGAGKAFYLTSVFGTCDVQPDTLSGDGTVILAPATTAQAFAGISSSHAGLTTPPTVIPKGKAANLPYDNGASGLVATDVQAAIDEVKAITDVVPDVGALAANFTAQTAEYTALLTDGTIEIAGGGTIPLHLPDPSTFGNGRQLLVIAAQDGTTITVDDSTPANITDMVGASVATVTILSRHKMLFEAVDLPGPSWEWQVVADSSNPVVEQTLNADGAADPEADVIGCDTDVAAGTITVDMTALTILRRSVIIDNIGATDDVIIDATVSGAVSPHIPPGESRTVYVGAEGFRFH